MVECNTLKHEKYHEKLNSTLYEYYTSDTFTDVTLVCNDQKEVRCHRTLLRVWSPLLKDILDDVPQDEDPVIHLDNANSKQVSILLDILFKGEVNIHKIEEVEDLLLVAKHLGVPLNNETVVLKSNRDKDNIEEEDEPIESWIGDIVKQIIDELPIDNLDVEEVEPDKNEEVEADETDADILGDLDSWGIGLDEEDVMRETVNESNIDEEFSVPLEDFMAVDEESEESSNEEMILPDSTDSERTPIEDFIAKAEPIDHDEQQNGVSVFDNFAARTDDDVSDGANETSNREDVFDEFAATLNEETEQRKEQDSRPWRFNTEDGAQIENIKIKKENNVDEKARIRQEYQNRLIAQIKADNLMKEEKRQRMIRKKIKKKAERVTQLKNLKFMQDLKANQNLQPEQMFNLYHETRRAMNKNSELLYQCQYCPFQSKQLVTVKQHLNTKTCIPNKSSLKEIKTPGPSSSSSSSSSMTRIFLCSVCGFKGKSRDVLIQHVKQTHSDNQTKKGLLISCDQCGQKFTKMIHLQQHHSLAHDPQQKSYQCPTCPFRSNDNSDYVRHMNTPHVLKHKARRDNV